MLLRLYADVLHAGVPAATATLAAPDAAAAAAMLPSPRLLLLLLLPPTLFRLLCCGMTIQVPASSATQLLLYTKRVSKTPTDVHSVVE